MGLSKGGLVSGGGGGPATSLGPGATGTTLVLSGSSTAQQFISTQASGSDGFLVTTNGARWHFGLGADDYASSDGTTVTFAGRLAATTRVTAGELYSGTHIIIANGSTGNLYLFNRILIASTAPTVVAGAGATVVTANGTAAFTIDLGGAAQTGTITLPSATTGWVVYMQDVTTPASFVLSQTGGSPTTATFTCYSRTTGLAINWNANDIARCIAIAY